MLIHLLIAFTLPLFSRCDVTADKTTDSCPADGCATSNEDQSAAETTQTDAAVHQRRILFDSDPGLDDAFALIWLLNGFKTGLYDIAGLTTVQGNTAAFAAYRNVMHMVNLSMPALAPETREIRTKLKSIPIAKLNSSNEAGDADYTSLDNFFDHDGLNGLSETFKQFPNVFASDSKAKKWFKNTARTPFSVDFIIETLQRYPHQVSVLCVGPVSNLYAAELKSPGVLSLARDVYIMGGSFEHGNTDDLTEFNFQSDPKAIYEFFQVINAMPGRRPNVYIFPLDVTRTLRWSVDQFELLYSLLPALKQSEIEMCRMKIDGIDDEVQEMYDVQSEDVYCTKTGLMYHFLEKATEKMIIAHYEWGIGDYMEFHDLSLVGFLLYPHLFEWKTVHCRIDQHNGMIYYDKRLVQPTKDKIKTPNCMIATHVDQEQFIKGYTRDMLNMLKAL